MQGKEEEQEYQWWKEKYSDCIFRLDWDNLPNQIRALRDKGWDEVMPSYTQQEKAITFDFSIERRFGHGQVHAMCWDILYQDNLKSLWISLHHSTKVRGEHLDQIAEAIKGIEAWPESAPQNTLDELGIILSKTQVTDQDLEKLLLSIKCCTNLKQLKLYIDDTNCTESTINNITNAIKDLKSLEYVRVWHNEGMNDAVEMLRTVLNKELKLWRFVSADCLTQYARKIT